MAVAFGSLLARDSSVEISYEVLAPEQAAPVVVFHPGLGLTRGSFRPLAALLSSRVKCLLFDPRGTGASKPAARIDVDVMVDDLLALLDALGIRRAMIFGHSLGANVAVATAVAAPARIERLFLCAFSAATDLAAPLYAGVRRAATPEQSAELDRLERAGPVLTSAGYVAGYAELAGALWTPHAVHRTVSDDVAASLAQDPVAASALWGTESAFRITGTLRDLDQRDVLASLTCPITILSGAYDAITAPSTSLARALVPRVDVVELSHSAHNGHAEEPARCAEAVLARLPHRNGLRAVDIAAGSVEVAAAGAARGVVDAPVVALRPDVARVDVEGVTALEDGETGARVGLGDVEAAIVACFGAPLDEVVARAHAALGAEYDAAQVHDAVAAFVASLSAQALLAEGLSTAAIHARQRALRMVERAAERAAALNAALDDARARVPFHRARISSTVLDDIPVMTRADVRANLLGSLAPDGADVKGRLERGELTINSTSGSTDERLQVLFDPRAGTLPDGYGALWDRDEDLDKGAIFTSPICAGFECHLGRSTQEERTRGVTLTLNSCDDPMAITDDEVRAIAGEMNAFAPRVLFVNPWYAAWLLRRVRALSLSLPPIDVVLSSYQYLTRRHRRLLREGFGAPVYSYYGATDLGGALVGVECHRGRMHVREDHVHVELARTRADGLAQILVTTLASPHMPLVRYDIGDVARADEPCPCGKGAEWRTFVLEGRRKDLLLAVDGSAVTTREVDDAVGDNDLDFWRLEQDGARAYTLTAMPAAGFDRTSLLARLARLLGAEAKVNIDEVKVFSPERSLKFRQTSSALTIPW